MQCYADNSLTLLGLGEGEGEGEGGGGGGGGVFTPLCDFWIITLKREKVFLKLFNFS